MKWNKLQPLKLEELLTKRHFKYLDGINLWNHNNRHIIVYIRNDTDINRLYLNEYLNTILKMSEYENEFRCMSISFNIDMVEKFINLGYIILSQKIYANKNVWTSKIKYNKTRSYKSAYCMCAIVYDTYPVLFLSDLVEPKISLTKFNVYELKINTDFEKIVDNCSKIHGETWLIKPLRDCFKKIYKTRKNIQLVSFGVYKNNELKAGEFGIISGKIYISYSGYHIESSAGTIQMIKMFRYLKNMGILCCNLFGSGEKYGYKYKFGAVDYNREDYIKIFRLLRDW